MSAEILPLPADCCRHDSLNECCIHHLLRRASYCMDERGITGDRQVALPLYESLRHHEALEEGLVAVLARFADRRRPASLAIGLGVPAAERALLTVLERLDDMALGELLLNCGHPGLEGNAQEWANTHGYTIRRRTGTGPHWGRFI